MAQTLPPGFTLTELDTPGLESPTCLEVAPDGRIFIAEQTGAIKIWKESSGLRRTPFYTFDTIPCGEGGVIGMALDPEFATNGYMYVHYTDATCAPSRIVRIQAETPSSDVADRDSELVLFTVPATGSGHNGGCLRFGIDGRLYCTVGDHGSFLSQSLETCFGKMLRINKDGSIPDDNPDHFDGVEGTTFGELRSIYAIGLRNPFRFAVQPETGRIFANDVGDSSFEEIDEIMGGGNYGYPATEGSFVREMHPGFTEPVLAYAHAASPFTGNCILGGTFYNPTFSPFPPEYFGTYFFGDHNYGAWINRIDPITHQVSQFITDEGGAVDMHIDNRGRLLFARYFVNKLYRVDYSLPLPPVVVRPPMDTGVCVGETARLSVIASGSGPVTYQWRHNGVNLVNGSGISGARSRELGVIAAVPADGGEYTCFVQNANGNTLSAPAVLLVGTQNGTYDARLIRVFVSAILTTPPKPRDLCRFDFDHDGHVDLNDADAMITALLGD